MSDGLAASTVTPGKTAPDVSLTTPAMMPVDCAALIAGRRRRNVIPRLVRNDRLALIAFSFSQNRECARPVQSQNPTSGLEELYKLITVFSPPMIQLFGCGPQSCLAAVFPGLPSLSFLQKRAPL